LTTTIGYDTTPFIRESIQEVFKALRDAILLVAVVVLVFLQSWRSAIIPLVAVPVAVVGTFAVMLAARVLSEQTSPYLVSSWQSVLLSMMRLLLLKPSNTISNAAWPLVQQP
jgi:ABC-type multidrug transport system fused ATPase/permease subunit